jgi:acetyl-CoA carboxylase carboxyl transferase subunit alpha
LWKERSRSPDAAEALKLTAKDLIEMKVIDGIIKEPLGGAHREPQEAAANIKKAIKKELAVLKAITKDKLINARYDKIRSVGVFKEP